MTIGKEVIIYPGKDKSARAVVLENNHPEYVVEVLEDRSEASIPFNSRFHVGELLDIQYTEIQLCV